MTKSLLTLANGPASWSSAHQTPVAVPRTLVAPGGPMTPKQLHSTSYILLACCLAISFSLNGAETRPVSAGLTAHEWGTFTSIAGEKGQAIEWAPLTGSTDLPAFVEHFRGTRFKLGLRGTVRMETPVLYFYDSREETVSVHVSFSKGVITEWYPRANRVEPEAALYDASLNGKQPDGSIAWDSVTVSPNQRADFPSENRDNRYYAARQTSATPVRVSTPRGEQSEKFLFYRGVSAFSLPISASLAPDGKLLVQNRGEEEIPSVILFERRGDEMGYRLGGAVKDRSVLDPPALTENMDSLSKDLEGILVARGLYQDEAHAMLEAWRTSWFEEGTRLLYIVPTNFVNSVVPLSISPAPAQTVRVFVGRLEIVTPATERAVERALASHDTVTIAKYERFLEPILQSLMKKESNPGKLKKLQQSLDSYRITEVAKNQSGN